MCLLTHISDPPQWKDEIESKTNEMFSVHLHHGKDKLKVCLFAPDFLGDNRSAENLRSQGLRRRQPSHYCSRFP